MPCRASIIEPGMLDRTPGYNFHLRHKSQRLLAVPRRRRRRRPENVEEYRRGRGRRRRRWRIERSIVNDFKGERDTEGGVAMTTPSFPGFATCMRACDGFLSLPQLTRRLPKRGHATQENFNSNSEKIKHLFLFLLRFPASKSTFSC